MIFIVFSGSFLGGVFRSVFPLLKKAGMSVGREVFRGAAGVLDDIGNDTNINTALRTRGIEAYKNLKNAALAKLNGSGGIKCGSAFKRGVKRKRTQSVANTSRQAIKPPPAKKAKKAAAKKKKAPKKKAAKKNKKTKKDYFSS